MSSGKRPKFTLEMSLAVKLASVVVHADEYLTPRGASPLGHPYDAEALKVLVRDPEVVAWIKSLGPLAPVKR